MKQQFIARTNGGHDRPDEASARNVGEARMIAPWAAKLIRCEGGWQAFESMVDADTWRNQA